MNLFISTFIKGTILVVLLGFCRQLKAVKSQRRNLIINITIYDPKQTSNKILILLCTIVTDEILLLKLKIPYQIYHGNPSNTTGYTGNNRKQYQSALRNMINYKKCDTKCLAGNTRKCNIDENN
jgi:hypothetical protein